MRRIFLGTLLGGAGLFAACGNNYGDADGETDAGIDATVGVASDATTDDGQATPSDSGLNAIDAGSDSAADAGECAVNADCTARGANYICRKTDFACVSLVSAECTHIFGGDPTNDDAVFLGSILPTTGSASEFGLAQQNAINLAIEDFNQTARGLPPVQGATKRRPLVLVGCNDELDPARAVTAAKHLVEDLKLPAIIGAASSAATLEIATKVTIPSGTFLISPSATSPALTGLADNGLVWRTATPASEQAVAHAAFYPSMESTIKGGNALKKVTVAIAHKDDALGVALSDGLSAKLVVNGAPFVSAANADYRVVANYGSDASPQYATAISAVIAKKPDLVYVMGGEEAITEIVIGIETAWDAANGTLARPYYMVAESSLKPVLIDYINSLGAAAADAIRRRIFGTQSGSTTPNFGAFRSHYRQTFGASADPIEPGIVAAHDATYNIAYAINTRGARRLEGADIRTGFGFLVAGPTTIEMGPQGILNAFSKLEKGGKLDYQGGIGPLDYDLATGEAPGDFFIMCVPENASGMAVMPSTAVVAYQASTKAILGSFDALATACNF